MIYLARFICLLALLASACCSASSFPHKYDRQFKSSSARYMPGVDWKLLKAQCWQESRFIVDAVSPVGAKGVCQFMPATWDDVQQELDFVASPFTADLNIEAAAYYMGKLRKGWSSPRPEFDKHTLAMASYNAGFGNLLKAQKKCDMATLYPCIEKCLPKVTGSNANETKHYVRSIWRYYGQMRLNL